MLLTVMAMTSILLLQQPQGQDSQIEESLQRHHARECLLQGGELALSQNLSCPLYMKAALGTHGLGKKGEERKDLQKREAGKPKRVDQTSQESR